MHELSFLRSFLCKFRDNELKAAQSIFKAWYVYQKMLFQQVYQFRVIVDFERAQWRNRLHELILEQFRNIDTWDLS